MAFKEFIGVLFVVILFLLPIISILWEEGFFKWLKSRNKSMHHEHKEDS